jgi:hypothetical protein
MQPAGVPSGGEGRSVGDLDGGWPLTGTELQCVKGALCRTFSGQGRLVQGPDTGCTVCTHPLMHQPGE